METPPEPDPAGRRALHESNPGLVSPDPGLVSPDPGLVSPDPGGHVFEVDGTGGVLRDTYAAGGSGMQLAYGALEDAYRDDLTTTDARSGARASGNGVTVTREGEQVEAYADAEEVA